MYKNMSYCLKSDTLHSSDADILSFIGVGDISVYFLRMIKLSRQNKSKAVDMEALMPQFVQLLTANQHRIHGYILSITGNSAVADDVMQETTAMMWKKYSDFKPGTDFVAWGVTIARYVNLNYRKKHTGKTIQLSDNAIRALDGDVFKVLKKTDYRMDSLKECVSKLPPKDQKILELRFFEGHSIKMVAERVGKSDRSVFRSFARVYDLLMNCIQSKLAGEV